MAEPDNAGAELAAGAGQVILTGRSAGLVRDCLPGAVEQPDLVLAGIALAAERACSR
jgi:hypothetical protein